MIQETINRVEVPVGGGSPGGPVSWNSVTGKPSTFAPSAHKSTHATGGSDALAPADIGAATAAQGAKADNSIQRGDNQAIQGSGSVGFGGGNVITIYDENGGGGVALNPSSITLYDGCSLQFTGVGATQAQTNFRNHIGAVGLSANSYVIALPGDNLATKYGQAKVLTPNGNARSATNRASLIVFPGVYSISSELAIDTEFVDIIGLGAQFQSPAVIVTNNTLNVTANDVRVSGISVGTQQFSIANNKPLQRFENCVGGNQSFTSSVTTSGTFLNCVAGSDSFGGSVSGTSSGTFKNCIGGNDCFGATASGVFENCTGGDGCFGLNTASGDFKNCVGGVDSFGGTTLTGELISCRLVGAGESYSTPSGSGIIRFCLDGDNNIVNAG